MEVLEDLTVPAVRLTYGGPGTALALNEQLRGTTSVTISEPTAGTLLINLNRAVFGGGSTAAAPGLAYQNPGSPTTSHSATIDISALNDIADLVADLPGDALNLGAIANTAGGLANLNASAGAIGVPNGATVDTRHAAAGSGNIALTAEYFVAVNSGAGLLARDGNITLEGNEGGASRRSNFAGIDINGGNVETTGSGSILLQGRGGNDRITGDHNGVWLCNGATVKSAGGGHLTLDGIGGRGTAHNHGVLVEGTGTQVISVSGAITLTGTGGRGTSDFNMGVAVELGAQVISMGTAPIALTGTGGRGTHDDEGLFIGDAGTQVTSVSGAITLTGIGGRASSYVNRGVVVAFGAHVTSTGMGPGAAPITLTGTGGRGTDGTDGVVVEDRGTQVTSVSGAITLTGKGGRGTSTFNDGVVIHHGAQVTSMGTGPGAAPLTLSGTGGRGTAHNHGVEIAGAGTRVTSVSGAITVNGTGGRGTSKFNTGVAVLVGAQVTSASGAITVTGTRGRGADANRGVEVSGGALVTSESGAVTVSGSGSGGSNQGIYLGRAAEVTSTSGRVTITSTGGRGTSNFNTGVALLAGAQVASVPGAVTGTGGHSSLGVGTIALSPIGALPPLTRGAPAEQGVPLAAGGGGSLSPAQPGPPAATGLPPPSAETHTADAAAGGVLGALANPEAVLPGKLALLQGEPDSPGREDVPSGADLAGLLLTGARPRVKLSPQKGQPIGAVPSVQPGEEDAGPAAAPQEQAPWTKSPIGLNNPLLRRSRKRLPGALGLLPEPPSLTTEPDASDQVPGSFPSAGSPLSARPGPGDEPPPATGEDRRWIAHVLTLPAGRVALALALLVGGIGLFSWGDRLTVDRARRSGALTGGLPRWSARRVFSKASRGRAL